MKETKTSKKQPPSKRTENRRTIIIVPEKDGYSWEDIEKEAIKRDITLTELVKEAIKEYLNFSYDLGIPEPISPIVENEENNKTVELTKEHLVTNILASNLPLPERHKNLIKLIALFPPKKKIDLKFIERLEIIVDTWERMKRIENIFTNDGKNLRLISLPMNKDPRVLEIIKVWEVSVHALFARTKFERG